MLSQHVCTLQGSEKRKKMKLVLALVLFAAAVIGCNGKSHNLRLVHDSQSLSFKVFLGDNEWLRSGALYLRSAGAWWSSTNKDSNILKQVGNKTLTGRDTFGNYKSYLYEWQGYKDPNTPDTGVKVQTVSYVYDALPDLLVFDIVYVSGLSQAAIADTYNMTLSTFPSFVLEETAIKRGYLTWAGNMAKESKIGVWSPKGDGVYGDIDGGFPLAVFDSTMENTVVMSPLNTFMSANQMTLMDENTGEKLVTFGPLNSIDTVPAGYTFRTMVVSGRSVLSTMGRFGELLRGYYGKDGSYRRTDFSINYLGYWTDNGACYYYNTSSQYSNYENLLKSVKKDADASSIPYRYLQIDSWWYYKGKDNGVTTWTPRPDIFPNGIEAVVKETGWPIVAHNRWWSPETDYAKTYKFIVEDNIALPVDPSFWDYLISSSQTKWGLMVYEQDWLDYQFPRTKALLTTLGLGEKWLQQMGESAMRYGVTIQYCMPWTRHVLQSVAIPAVTQIRVSDDYQPSNSQWTIGDTTILANAVGLAAFKDNFRTSSNQPGCKKYGHMTENYPALETYVSALSAGPVGPSDQIGTYNKTLLMATCMMDGHLLKPSHPAMSIDSTFLQRAFGSGGPDGQLWAAFTLIDRHSWYYVLAADLKEDYHLTPQDLSPINSIDQLIVAYQFSIATGNTTQIVLPSSMKDHRLTISKCGKDDFQYWAIITSVAALPNGRYLLGELNKIIPVSESRFSNWDSGVVTVHGMPGEVVTVSVFDMIKDVVFTVACTVHDNGATMLIMGSTGDVPPYCK